MREGGTGRRWALMKEIESESEMLVMWMQIDNIDSDITSVCFPPP